MFGTTSTEGIVRHASATFRPALLALPLLLALVGGGRADATPLVDEGGTLVDTDLEAGFPTKALKTSGVYSRPYVTVGNIDEEPTLEILVAGIVHGPSWREHPLHLDQVAPALFGRPLDDVDTSVGAKRPPAVAMPTQP
ncbi:MAG: hypothetical protein M3265_10590 [Actinomycetota bacterium]|nr:hypothetical protein [Actinomycetota bacterium]